MKRLWLGLLAGLLLALVLAPVQAVGVSEGPSSMAKYFTANTQIFLSIRTDDGYIETLDGILSKVTRTLGESGIPVPPISLAEQLAAADFGNGISYADIRAWLGDYAAVGLGGLETLVNNPDAVNEGEAPLSIVVQIKDKATAAAFFEGLIPPNALEKTEKGDYIIFTDPSGNTPIFLAFGSEVLVITNRRDQLPGVTRMATLDSNTQLQDAFNRLPAPSYNFIGYLDGAALWDLVIQQVPQEQLGLFEAQGLGVGALGPIAFGATILEGRTLAIDVAQQSSMTANMVSSPLSADFLGLLPASADAVAVASNLSASVESALQSLSSMAQQMDQPDPSAQIEGAVQIFGIDLREDVLSWTTGGYALVFGLDFEPILAFAADPTQIEAIAGRLPADFGLLLEATDPAKAQALAEKLTTTLTGFVQASPDVAEQVTVGEITIGSATLSSFSVALPLGGGATLPITLVLGADDRVFFLGLQSTAEAIFAGSDKLVDTAAYQDAAQFFIPDSAQLLYTNDEGLAETLVIPGLALLGPAIGNVFDNIVEDLESSNGSLSQAVQIPAEGLAQVTAALRAFNALVASSSATGAVDGDWAIGRLALTFEP